MAKAFSISTCLMQSQQKTKTGPSKLKLLSEQMKAAAAKTSNPPKHPPKSAKAATAAATANKSKPADPPKHPPKPANPPKSDDPPKHPPKPVDPTKHPLKPVDPPKAANPLKPTSKASRLAAAKIAGREFGKKRQNERKNKHHLNQG